MFDDVLPGRESIAERQDFVGTFTHDDARTFVGLLERYPEIVDDCSRREKRVTFLHLAIATRCKQIASRLIELCFNSLFPSMLCQEILALDQCETETEKFCARNRNLMNLLFTVGEAGCEHTLKKLLKACVDDEARDRLLKALSIKCWEFSDDSQDSIPDDPAIGGNVALSAVEAMQHNRHFNLIQKIVKEVRRSENLELRQSLATSLLKTSCQTGDADVVKLLITALKCDVDEPDAEGFSPLHIAACYNHANVVGVLLDEGKADLNTTTTGGCLGYPIAFAAALGHAGVVDTFLSRRDALSPSKDAIVRSLHAATAGGFDDIIASLVRTRTCDETANDHNDNTVAIDSDDADGNTALMVAVSACKVETMELLMQLGADLEHQNTRGDNAWIIAIRNKDVQTLERLEKLMRTQGLRFTRRCTVIHEAIRNNLLEYAFWFLEMGVEPTWTDDQNNTMFHVAAEVNAGPLLSHLLRRYAYTDIAAERNSRGMTALELAVVNDHLSSVDSFMAEAPGYLILPNSNGFTALHMTVFHDHAGLAQFMTVNKKPELLAAPDIRGRTALHWAALQRRSGFFWSLRDANPDVPDGKGYTPLHMAAASAVGSDCSALKMFLELFYASGGDKRKPDEISGEFGLTALMICALNGNVEGVRLLLEHGAEVDVVNGQGENVAHVLAAMSIRDQLTSVRIWDAIVTFVVANEVSGVAGRKRLLKLTRQTTASTESPIQLASALGSVDFLRAVLSSTSSFVSQRHGQKRSYYDVRTLLPNSLTRMRRRNDEAAEGGNAQMRSCLEMISEHCDGDQIVAMMKIEPLRILLTSFSRTRTLAYTVSFAIHIAYMSSFTSCVQTDIGANANAGYSGSKMLQPQSSNVRNFGGFLAWPLLIFLYEVVCFVKWLTNLTNGTVDVREKCAARLDEFKSGLASLTDEKPPSEIELASTSSCCCCSAVRWLWKKLASRTYTSNLDTLSHLSSLTYCALVAVWYHQYATSSSENFSLGMYRQLTAVTLVYGWLQSVEYVKGIAALHAFVVTIKLIFYKDVLSILFMYSLVVVGFAAAVQIFLFEETKRAADFAGVVYQMYGVTIGVGSFFDDATLTNNVTGLPTDSVNIVRLVFAIYLLLTSVVLMNVLIAMMNGTYETVDGLKETLWCVDCLKFVVWISRDNWFGLRSICGLLTQTFVIDTFSYGAESDGELTIAVERQDRGDTTDYDKLVEEESESHATTAAHNEIQRMLKTANNTQNGLERLYTAMLNAVNESLRS
jgi:ankyrin repeat protein